ncbi:unnamed protein product [Spirodela intermedia]|uniref:Uncharacterized protein n=2 Tax=Spirodela intermedia TaxID=51605 RepID=A0A7I8K7P0_SPIIN|nr:unnamed protein product [Spirodela intermedia]CAA6657469.1 unnamed protein product [Spirodela intermedia]CAA7393535.1 unnamed protein product [Spirodela intermedia]
MGLIPTASWRGWRGGTLAGTPRRSQGPPSWSPPSSRP